MTVREGGGHTQKQPLILNPSITISQPLGEDVKTIVFSFPFLFLFLEGD